MYRGDFACVWGGGAVAGVLTLENMSIHTLWMTPNTKYLVPSLTLINPPTSLSNLIRNGFVLVKV